MGGGPYSEAQARTIDAALELFAEHGVSATSYQMIANALGITKAAVYHQFRTKEEIVVGAWIRLRTTTKTNAVEIWAIAHTAMGA